MGVYRSVVTNLLLSLFFFLLLLPRYRRAAGVYEKAANKLKSASTRSVYDDEVRSMLVLAADCHEKEGYYANAMDDYRQAADMASKMGDGQGCLLLLEKVAGACLDVDPPQIQRAADTHVLAAKVFSIGRSVFPPLSRSCGSSVKSGGYSVARPLDRSDGWSVF